MSKFEGYSYEKFREEYPVFYYHGFNIEDHNDYVFITYDFEIEGLKRFKPTLKVPKNPNLKYDKNLLSKIVFSAGLAEIPSYWKPTCSPKIIIECGTLDDFQTKWLKKLMFNGLGEFFYSNKIHASIDDFVNIESKGDLYIFTDENTYDGFLVAVGGGKDSITSLEILKEEKNKKAFIMNNRKICFKSAYASGMTDNDILNVQRGFDLSITELNKEGCLNGHTPISSCIAFISYLTAYLNGFKYVVLSNESSANEASVKNTNINHQYSKSFEFEQDFRLYTSKYLTNKIEYFSLLRSLSELQIMKIFTKYPKYFENFTSCNKGGTFKNMQNKVDGWCCSCAKCLFIYIIMSNFVSQDIMEKIFGENLLDKKELKETFLELLGKRQTKPFDCVGTIDEVTYSVNNLIKMGVDKYLLRFYRENYIVEEPNSDLLNIINEENNIPGFLLKYVEGELNNVNKKYHR